MNSKLYTEILLSWIENIKILNDNKITVQYNNPKHKSSQTYEFNQENNIGIIDLTSY